MASKASDTFTRPNQQGLGRAETGQLWTPRGTANAEIKDGRVLFPLRQRTIYTLDAGLGGSDGSLNLNFVAGDGGGQSLYFRVLDVNRWWRLTKWFNTYEYPYTYQSGTTAPTPAQYGWIGNGKFYYTPAGGFVHTHNTLIPPGNYGRGLVQKNYYDYDDRIKAYRGLIGYNTIYQPSAPGGFNSYREHYTYRSVHEEQAYVQTAPEKPGEPIYSTGYATATTVEARLEKCVNGQVSLVKNVAVNHNTLNSFGVTLDGPKISCFSNDGTLWPTVEDPTHQMAQHHGVGLDETSTVLSAQGIESFSAIPFVISGYIPPLML